MINVYILLIISNVHGPPIGRKMKNNKVNKKSKAACSDVRVEDIQGGIWFGMNFYPKTQVSPIFLADEYFMKVNEIDEKLMGSERHPNPLIQYRSGFA